MPSSTGLDVICSHLTRGGNLWVGDDHPIASLSGVAPTAQEVLGLVYDPGDEMALSGPGAEPPLEGAAARP